MSEIAALIGNLGTPGLLLVILYRIEKSIVPRVQRLESELMEDNSHEQPGD